MEEKKEEKKEKHPTITATLTEIPSGELDVTKCKFPFRMNDAFFRNERDAEKFFQFMTHWGTGYDGIIDKMDFDCSHAALLKKFNGIFYEASRLGIHYFQLTEQGMPSHVQQSPESVIKHKTLMKEYELKETT